MSYHEPPDQTGVAPKHKEAAERAKAGEANNTPMVKKSLTESTSYSQRIIDFSLDEDKVNRWKFVGFIRAVNPTCYDNPNPFAVQQYIEAGMGYCACCGHSPIVNHYIVSHPTKGQRFVGSECIGKVLGQSAQNAIKTITTRGIREYNNRKKLEVLLARYEQFFKEHPEILNITTGLYETRWVKYLSRCALELSIERFISEHKNCSDFMKKAHETQAQGMKNAVYEYGCKKHRISYQEWKEQKKNDPAYKSKCEENALVVSDLSEIKPVEGCPDPKACWVFEPVNPEENGQDILNKIRQAYERNYKDIDYIYQKIKWFNQHKVKTGDKVYNGELQTKIPIFSGRDLSEQPLTEDEENERAQVLSEALKTLVQGRR